VSELDEFDCFLIVARTRKTGSLSEGTSNGDSSSSMKKPISNPIFNIFNCKKLHQKLKIKNNYDEQNGFWKRKTSL